jgi:hypothetical protein
VPTVADIVRRHGPGYVQQFGARMSADQLRALRDLAACRTPALGGQRWCCPQCGEQVFAFHSCGNRHCPQCGADDARRWLDRQQALLLPVTYHLCTFTVPDGLRRLIRAHPRQLLPLLFRSASSTLLDLCANPRWFGATPGLTAVLHTWTRQLIYHPHIHFLVTGGGLDTTGAWRQPERDFLVPVHALSKVFRARFREALRAPQPKLAQHVPAALWRKPWVVHSQPVGSGAQALRYLSRYLYRVALANAAILHADAHRVSFRYRDSAARRPRTCTLPPQEFLRRFLQHVLPKGFVKVRYYGLHHPARRADLTLIRAALALRAGQPLPAPATPTAAALRPQACRCPRCHTPMAPLERIKPQVAFSPFARGPPTA